MRHAPAYWKSIFVSEVLLPAEKFLRDFAALWEWRFDMPRNNLQHVLQAHAESLQQSFQFFFCISQGCLEFKKARMHIAGAYWRYAFCSVEKVIVNSFDGNVVNLMRCMLYLHSAGCSEVVAMLQQHVSQYARIHLSTNHPRYAIYVALAELRPYELQGLVERASRLFMVQLDKVCGRRSHVPLKPQFDHMWLFSVNYWSYQFVLTRSLRL
jgi:hypothetical protein